MDFIAESLESRRLLAGFVLNSSFGNAGVVNIEDAAFPDPEQKTTAFVDGEGRAIVATPFTNSDGDKQFVIRRFHADGTVDKNFDGDGKLLFTVGGHKQPDPMITVLNDNSIVVAMRQANQPLLQRYTVRGKLDATFAAKADSVYKRFLPDLPDNTQEKLYLDPTGRVIFEQYLAVSDGRTQFTMRISRFDPDGSPDTTFGTRGGFSIDQNGELPPTYSVLGRTLNRRFVSFISAPQIDSDGNVVLAGSQTYARGSAAGAGISYSHFSLPFAFSFDRTGTLNRKLIVGFDESKASLSGQRIIYHGLQGIIDTAALRPDGVLFSAGTSIDRLFPTGLVIYKPDGDTFDVIAADQNFVTLGLQTIGNTVWSLDVGQGVGRTNRMIALDKNGNAGETIGLAGTNVFGEVSYHGVIHDRPASVIGFTPFKTGVRTLSLTEQQGTMTIENNVAHFTATAGEDYITIDKRSDGRLVVTGAGPTRSLPASIAKIQIDALGGDDVVNDDEFGLVRIKTPLILNGDGGNDTLNGFRGADVIDGGSGDDLLIGSFNDDSLFGRAGNDTLFGFTGVDQISGGSGVDTAVKDPDDTPVDSVETFEDVLSQ